ncbi:hypothetical protein ASD44_06990 [Mesorhizobium sp. Root554]|uniref:hypothetical protein n=1 Tax=unclassified Mesorhizobium TaxID=325217 RepID=UPI0006FA1D6D|nr:MULTISPECIES: hypothetical protein [unclassified Mesorhizobium]KQZ13847.1 hypothetical protein ASD27_06995 [Mesorhizobium sp. Root1471]KQZ36359.1 hypothetical protein ASD44_06990 [Mesorhizobium sp. Root554]
MTVRKIRKADRAAIAGSLMLTPMVMAMRIPLMAAENGGVHGMGKEARRAILEKNAAFAQGVVAAQLSLVQSAADFWTDVFAGKTPALISGVAAERSILAALGPASRAVNANYRRLSPK